MGTTFALLSVASIYFNVIAVARLRLFESADTENAGLVATTHVRLSPLSSSVVSHSQYSSGSHLSKVGRLLSSATDDRPRPFPRWGDTVRDETTHGLDLKPMLDFILNSSSAAYGPQQQRRSHRNPAYIPTTDHAKDVNYWFPETLYVLDHRGLWVSRRHRNITHAGPGSVKDKLVPTEAVAMLAWQHLRQADDADDGHRWPRLRQQLFHHHHDDDNNDNNRAAIGFPYLSWYGDFTGCNDKNWQGMYSIPLFTTAAAVHCQYAFPFPTYQTARDAQPDPSAWDRVQSQYHLTYPWNRQRPQIVWRGSLTGQIIPDAHPQCPRWRMLQTVMAFQRDAVRNHHPEQPLLFDVGVTRIPARHKHISLNISEIGGFKEGIKPMADFQKYRGILDVDGNSWSSRFGNLLCYNSVILKVEPSWVDYFHFKPRGGAEGDVPTLQPWIHYVPVRSDFSDLVEKSLFVVDPANDRILKRMVAEANLWCRHHMVQSSVAKDMLDIWERYVQLLDIANPHWSNDQWKPATERIFAPDSPLDMILLSSD